MRLIDIIEPVCRGMAVFFGRAAYQGKPTFRIGTDCPVNVAEFSVSRHCGAHADAPLHYDSSEASIDQLELDNFVGPARLIDARGEGSLSRPEDIEAMPWNIPPRVLLPQTVVFVT